MSNVRRDEMDTTLENILLVAAAMPAAYGFSCWIRRVFSAQRTAKWVKETHREEWDKLHWLAKRNAWAGIETLITKGLISGPQVNEFQARDEYLEKATWLGILVTAVLLLAIIVWKYAVSIFS